VHQVSPRQVGVLGYGAIGSVVAGELAAGRIPGAALAGVGLRPYRVGDNLAIGPAIGIDELIEVSNIVVEAAGQAALGAHGADVLRAGRDLVAVSTGALADRAVFESIVEAGPGRLYLCTGAVGGIDMIRAVRELGPINEARITTTKKPAGLVQERMTEAEVTELLSATERTVLFDGRIEELVALFPSSTNVAATTALALGSWDVLRGTVVADPTATLTSHVIEVDAVAGRYHFEMVNEPSVDHPRSSAVVPWAVVRTLRDLCGRSWTFL
jgi:aspartate dehydrogenase